MRILTEKINLDLNQNGIQATIDLREGDIESRLIIATLRGYGNAFRPDDNVIAIIRAKKPDGTIIYNNCLVEDGKIKFLVTSQYAAVEGNYNACIELIKDGVVLYSPKFSFHVAANELSDSEVESSSEYTELTTALEQALTALELAQNLHLLKFVENLEDEGDEKYLYVLTSDYHYIPYVWDAENERYMQLESNLEELTEFAYLLSIQKERVDNLLAEAVPGSTTRDLEVIDGRTGYDGRTYANLGTAIREQVNYLHEENFSLGDRMIAADDNLDNIKANKTDVNTTTANIEAEIAVERARIDQIANTPGSTTGDLELADIRVGADGTTYNNAGDAVRSQVDNLIYTDRQIYNNLSEIINQKVYLKNIGFLQTDGTIEYNTSARYTNYIYIKPYEEIKYKTRISNAAYEIAFFDISKNLLTSISVVGTNSFTDKTIDLTQSQYENAYFAIVSCYGQPYIDDFTCELTKNNNLKNRVTNLENNSVLNSDIVSYIDEYGNQFNKDTIISGKEVYNDGSIVDQANSIISDYIYVSGHNFIYLNNLPTYTDGIKRFYAFYDENKNPVSYGSNIDMSYSKTKIAIPQDAVYFVFTIYQRYSGDKTGYNNIMFSFYAYKEYEPFIEYIDSIDNKKIPKNNNNKTTNNKKLLLFGDSITETATISDDGQTYTEGTRINYPTYLTLYLQTSEMRNYAMTGATYKDRNNILVRQQVSDQINMAINDSYNDDAKIIIISLGTNDGNTDIGNYDIAMGKATLNDLDRTKLYEALRWAMWTLRQKYVNAKFFVGIPIQRADKEQSVEMIEAITKMAHRYDFIIINGLEESDIVRDFEVWGANGRYLYDGLHPNLTGSETLAKLYANVILRNFIVD